MSLDEIKDLELQVFLFAYEIKSLEFQMPVWA